MSAIISYDVNEQKNKISIYAPDSRLFIRDMDIVNSIIHITGDPKEPFIDAVRFIDCIIIAENLRAFKNCYFEPSCKLVVSNITLVNGYESINNNCVIQEPSK